MALKKRRRKRKDAATASSGGREQRLADAYFNLDNPSAFSSVQNVAKKAGVRVPDAQNWLQEQDAYTLHKNYRKTFSRRKIYSPALHHTLHGDLADLQKLGKYNDSFRYFLILVDAYSRQFFLEPVKSKASGDMEAAFERIFARLSWLPTAIVSDQGLEFYAKPMKAYFARKHISHYSTKSEVKASLAERGIRSVKARMFKALTHANSFRWIEMLPKIEKAINNSVNRTIGRTPASVGPGDLEDPRTPMTPKRARTAIKFAVGDTVRIVKHRQTFDKGYLPNFTQELFVVSAVKADHVPAYYKLKDLNGEPIDGSFYAEEMVRSTNREQVFKVERVLKSRTHQGRKQHFIRWLGYGPEFDSWIDADQVKRI